MGFAAARRRGFPEGALRLRRFLDRGQQVAQVRPGRHVVGVDLHDPAQLLLGRRRSLSEGVNPGQGLQQLLGPRVDLECVLKGADGQVRLLVEHVGARQALVAGNVLRPLADHGAKLGHGARPVPLEHENFTLGEVAFDALGVRLQHFADVGVGLVRLLQQQVHLGQAVFGLDDPRVGRVLAQGQALLQGLQGLLGLVQIEVDLAQQDAQLETLRLLRDTIFEDLGRLEGLPLRDVEACRRLPGLLAAGIGRHRIGDQVDGRGLAPQPPSKGWPG